MDDDAEALNEEFDPVVSLSEPLMKKVLGEVAMHRRREDGEEGFFRDFVDGTAVSQLDSVSLAEAKRRVKNAGNRITWRLQMDVATHEVSAVRETEQIRKRLVVLAALAVAWVEAIDRRKDEKRIELKMRGTLWQRLIAWWRRR